MQFIFSLSSWGFRSTGNNNGDCYYYPAIKNTAAFVAGFKRLIRTAGDGKNDIGNCKQLVTLACFLIFLVGVFYMQ